MLLEKSEELSARLFGFVGCVGWDPMQEDARYSDGEVRSLQQPLFSQHQTSL